MAETEVPYWIVTSIFPDIASATAFKEWCTGQYIACAQSGIATVSHGNDAKSRGAEAESEVRGAVCPFGRIRTIKGSYTMFSPRTPLLPPSQGGEWRVVAQGERSIMLDRV